LLLFFLISEKGLAVRVAFACTGIWWLVFTLGFPARLLPRGKACIKPSSVRTYLRYAVRQTFGTVTAMYRHYPETFRFLMAYLIYNDGIQTVIVVATLFASDELGVSSRILMYLVLMIQFVAFLGSLFFGWMAQRIGARKSIMLSLLIWLLISVYAWAMLHSVFQLFILGTMAALVLGGSQALSRSLYSQLIPRERETQYFAFYEISEKGTSWVGPILFAGAVQLTGSSRVAILSLVLFFITGFILLCFLDVGKGMKDAGNENRSVVI